MVALERPARSSQRERAGAGTGLRLLSRRRFRWSPLLALSRRIIRARDRCGALVRAWIVCISESFACVFSREKIDERVRRTGSDHQLLFPARRVASARDG